MTSANVGGAHACTVSYQELKRHSTYTDAWISLNGTVYDVTGLLTNHPFGDTFRGNLGTECGGLFAATHFLSDLEATLKNPRVMQSLNVRVVGRLDVSTDSMHRDHADSTLERIRFKDLGEDAFWNDLKREVRDFLRHSGESLHYSTAEGALFLLYYVGISGLLAWLMWLHQSVLFAGLLGLHCVCALAHVSHMASHFGFTRNRLLNGLALHLYDLWGLSGLEWQIGHQTHHHQPHSSLDQQTNRYQYMGLRLHAHMPFRWWHRAQPVSYWLTIATYWPYKFVQTTLWLCGVFHVFSYKKDLAAHCVARMIFLLLWSLFVLRHGWGGTWPLLIAYSVTFSYSAFLLLYNNHDFTHEFLGGAEDVSVFHDVTSWAEAQVRTSGNWYPTNVILRFIEFHYGYFNYHIEHHLFPALKPPLLKKISPAVRRVCEQHQVPYITTTFWEMQRSLQRHLIRLGNPATTEDVVPGQTW